MGDARKDIRDMTGGEIVQLFSEGYGFVDKKGHEIAHCEDFVELVRMATNGKARPLTTQRGRDLDEAAAVLRGEGVPEDLRHKALLAMCGVPEVAFIDNGAAFRSGLTAAMASDLRERVTGTPAHSGSGVPGEPL